MLNIVCICYSRIDAGFPCNQFGGQEPADNSKIKQFAADRGANVSPSKLPQCLQSIMCNLSLCNPGALMNHVEDASEKGDDDGPVSAVPHDVQG